MKEINGTNTSPEERGENARPGKKREEAKPEEEETDKSGKKKNKKKKSKNHKKDTMGEKIVSKEDSETSSQLSSEDGEERGLREIKGKELGRGNTGQKEMAEDEEENLDKEEGKPVIDKEQKGEETQEEKKTEKERGRSRGKSKEKDVRDYLARDRSLSYKRAQPDTPVMNKGPSPLIERSEKRKE